MTVVFTYDYDTTYQPPMPMVELKVGPALQEASLELAALVDSGADATIVPLRYLRQLQARRSRKAWMRGTTGERVLIDLYNVAIRIGPYQQSLPEVVGVASEDEVIVGRDVLNHLNVTLNGPAYVTEVSS